MGLLGNVKWVVGLEGRAHVDDELLLSQFSSRYCVGCMYCTLAAIYRSSSLRDASLILAVLNVVSHH